MLCEGDDLEGQAKLREGIEPGFTHGERLDVARNVADLCLERYGARIAAIGICGSTAVERDQAYSDLDMTVLTYEDLGDQTKCYCLNGLSVNLDYQTVEESLKDEAAVPGEGGCWTSFLVLHDRGGEVAKLKSRYEALDASDIQQEFARRMRDPLNTYIGKARNAALGRDRSSLIWASLNFGIESCRAVQLINGHYTTGEAYLRDETKRLATLPEGFAGQIDIVMAQIPASDDDIYSAIEDLWSGMKQLASRHAITWLHTGIEP